MKVIKIVLLGLLAVLVIIQFIRPAWNKSESESANEITKVLVVPDSVRTILHNACYDCHSNNTSYPWYSNIQPVAWYLANDIKKAKGQLNFDDFAGYPVRRQRGKLSAIADEVSDNGMPLPSYRLMHKNARLSQEEKAHLINWAQHSQDILPGEQ
jgi:hypothetical protein